MATGKSLILEAIRLASTSALMLKLLKMAVRKMHLLSEKKVLSAKS